MLIVFFQLQNFALHIDGDLLRQIPTRDRRGHVRDISHLPGQVAGHRIHAVGQILPRARNAAHIRLAAKFSFASDLTGDTSHFRRKRTQLIDHGIDRIFELQYFAAHIDRDLF